MREITTSPRSDLAFAAAAVLAIGLGVALPRLLGGPWPLLAGWGLMGALTLAALITSLRQVCVLEGERVWVGRVVGPLRLGRWHRVARPFQAKLREEKLAYRTRDGETSRRWIELPLEGGVRRVGQQAPRALLKSALEAFNAP